MSLVVEDARFAYRRRVVLDGVDLAAREGAVLGLLGPNGAGKSTLLRCVCRILRPAAGSFRFRGVDLHTGGRRDLARLVAYVPQGGMNPFSLTVADAVLLGRTPHMGLRPSRHDWARVDEAISILGLDDLAHRRVGELSGGQAQRVLLARAVAQETPVLLLDEPTAALDVRHQIETLAAIRAIAANRAVAVVVAIHDLNLAGRFCDELVVLHDGNIAASGPPADVLTPEVVSRAYRVEVAVDCEDGIPTVRPVSPEAA